MKTSSLLLGRSCCCFGLILLACGVGLLPAGAIDRPAYPASVGRHRSYGAELSFTGGNELLARQPGPVVSPATRSTFMARWDEVGGALGYRLDVSSEPTFRTFVVGYHDLEVGNTNACVVTGLTNGRTYFFRVRASGPGGLSGYSTVHKAATTPSAGLVIAPTFDSSITNSGNAAAIEGVILEAIRIEETNFSDSMTIAILYRYATTDPMGNPLGAGVLGESFKGLYSVSWNGFVDALVADAKTSNDASANASLPGSPLSSSILPSSAGGRSVGLNTPAVLCADATICGSGPFYDGVITLNAAQAFQFSRPVVTGNYDAQRTVEHETDEVMALGSEVNEGSNYAPQDLFSWSAPGTRNFTPNGPRYFSIDSGDTDIVGFNQEPGGDYGDWVSPACPQTFPYVQDAFSCDGQFSDLGAPEAINLDVVGYDLAPFPLPDFNGDGESDFVLANTATRQTAIWFLNNNTFLSGAYGPALPAGWKLIGSADFNGDGQPDFLLYNPSSRQTAIWYLSGTSLVSSAYGPTISSGYSLVATADINRDGHPDFVLYNASTRQIAIWYLSNTVRVGSVFGPSLPSGYGVAAVADFNGDGQNDLLLYNASNQRTSIYYLSGPLLLRVLSGPTISAGYQVIGAADFNGDHKTDLVLFDPGTRQTAIWYLNNSIVTSGAFGPTIASGYVLVAP